MPRLAALALAALSLPTMMLARPAAAEPERYVIDQAHLSIAWSADHVGYGPTLGLFLTGGGEFTFDEEAKTLEAATFTVDASSVFSNHDARDKHLRGKDFLDAEAHPEIRFVMTSAEATGERTGVVTGDLTLRGVTKPVDVEVVWNKSGKYPFGGTYVMGVTATAV
ncbi:MAG: YceI family protein, partial [Pseudomonadota bacterium]